MRISELIGGVATQTDDERRKERRNRAIELVRNGAKMPAADMEGFAGEALIRYSKWLVRFHNDAVSIVNDPATEPEMRAVYEDMAATATVALEQFLLVINGFTDAEGENRFDQDPETMLRRS